MEPRAPSSAPVSNVPKKIDLAKIDLIELIPNDAIAFTTIDVREHSPEPGDVTMADMVFGLLAVREDKTPALGLMSMLECGFSVEKVETIVVALDEVGWSFLVRGSGIGDPSWKACTDSVSMDVHFTNAGEMLMLSTLAFGFPHPDVLAVGNPQWVAMILQRAEADVLPESNVEARAMLRHMPKHDFHLAGRIGDVYAVAWIRFSDVTTLGAVFNNPDASTLRQLEEGLRNGMDSIETVMVDEGLWPRGIVQPHYIRRDLELHVELELEEADMEALSMPLFNAMAEAVGRVAAEAVAEEAPLFDLEAR